MKRTLKLAIPAALTSAVLAASLIGVMSSGASAMEVVTCTTDDLLRVTLHHNSGGSVDECYDQKGELGYGDGGYWVTQISTGNNSVQWYGDGRWQPDQPIGPRTVFTWPNHPGGVSIDKIRIV